MPVPCWNSTQCKQDLSDVEVETGAIKQEDVMLYYELSGMPVQVWIVLLYE
jgi:hypothetical protein